MWKRDEAVRPPSGQPTGPGAGSIAAPAAATVTTVHRPDG